ncbi:hypothetical protein DEU56DRAFT_744668, partial [Suillus clintonianus]|uniref:uncharacterized protein n=1 Tax=Suillus clintonianus TaxID=1904413 RepID=UPI001B87CE6B
NYSGSVLAHYATGLKMWHVLHGQPWLINARELKATLGSSSPPPLIQAKRVQSLHTRHHYQNS